MTQIILALAIGVMIGRILKDSMIIKHVSKATLAGVAGLLFVMGAQIGSSPKVLSNLALLGFRAIVLATLGITGAVLVSLVLHRGQAS